MLPKARCEMRQDTVDTLMSFGFGFVLALPTGEREESNERNSNDANGRDDNALARTIRRPRSISIIVRTVLSLQCAPGEISLSSSIRVSFLFAPLTKIGAFSFISAGERIDRQSQ